MTKQKPINQWYTVLPSWDEAILWWPEEVDLIEHDHQYQEIQKNMGKEIVANISREQYIFWLLEKLTKKHENDSMEWIQEFIHHCRQDTWYNELFADSIHSWERIIENEDLARELLNHCLWSRGRKQGFTQEQRQRCKTTLHELTKEHTDVLSHLYTMMPASLQWASKVDLMTKVSILMLLIAQSHPEQFSHLDEFIEKNVFLDAMLQGKMFSETIEETLDFAQPLEMKNTGAIYNYRADDLFNLLYAAKDALGKVPEMLGNNTLTDALKRQRAKKNDPVLRTFQEWYETIQKKLTTLKQAWDSREQIYQAYSILTKLHFVWQERFHLQDERSVYAYLQDICEQECPDWNISDALQDILLAFFMPNYMWTPTEILAAEKKNAILKKHMSEVYAQLLEKKRWKDAMELPCVTSWMVILRLDGKIDMPSIGIKGMARLSVAWPTNRNDWMRQGDFVDQYGNTWVWVSWISYMTWERAMLEATKQGKKLFPEREAQAKTQALLATLWNNWAEQTKALQALFPADFSGYWASRSMLKRWEDVRYNSYVGVSEIKLSDTAIKFHWRNEGEVATIRFNSSKTDLIWQLSHHLRPWFAFDEC